MDHLQRARRQPKVLIDLELTGAMRTSENAVKAKFAELPFHALRCISLPKRCARGRCVACFAVLVASDTCQEEEDW